MRDIRPIRIEGRVALITLTQGFVAIIDAADAARVEGRNWFAQVKKNTVYAVSRGVFLHRFLTEAPAEIEVDHRSGDGLDNRRQNLRFATPALNRANQKRRKNNSSGFKGVYKTSVNRWTAQIGVGGKRICLGSFKNPEDAHQAYAKEAEKYYGEFSRPS